MLHIIVLSASLEEPSSPEVHGTNDFHWNFTFDGNFVEL